MKGTLLVARSLVEHGAPELQQCFVEFAARGIMIRQRNVGSDQSEITLDHPDFDVEDGRYDLVVTNWRDPAQFMNRSYKITKLQRITETGKFITIKEY